MDSHGKNPGRYVIASVNPSSDTLVCAGSNVTMQASVMPNPGNIRLQQEPMELDEIMQEDLKDQWAMDSNSAGGLPGASFFGVGPSYLSGFCPVSLSHSSSRIRHHEYERSLSTSNGSNSKNEMRLNEDETPFMWLPGAQNNSIFRSPGPCGFLSRDQHVDKLSKAHQLLSSCDFSQPQVLYASNQTSKAIPLEGQSSVGFQVAFDSACYSNSHSLQEAGHISKIAALDHVNMVLNSQCPDLVFLKKRSHFEGSLAAMPTSFNERITLALFNILSLARNDVLLQVWVPRREGERLFLTTLGQPCRLVPPVDDGLSTYRRLSTRYTFPAENGSLEDSVGLPGRVFWKKIPEWTPNVQFYRKSEYLRVYDAECCSVRGSLALPVLEKESGSCLAVIELVMLMEKLDYSNEIESICQALEVNILLGVMQAGFPCHMSSS